MLSGPNTYTGATTVSGGTLKLDFGLWRADAHLNNTHRHGIGLLAERHGHVQGGTPLQPGIRRDLQRRGGQIQSTSGASGHVTFAASAAIARPERAHLAHR